MGADSGARVDQVLVAKGLASSRTRAQTLIKSGAVSWRGQTLLRPSDRVPQDAELMLDAARAGEALPFVSRGGVKLAHALAVFGLSPTGATALDLGASTGGFTDVLLRAGASRVYAVDVGVDQLAPELRADPRVRVLDGVNVKALDRSLIPEPPGWLTADLSFISLAKALPAPLRMLAPAATAILLVKPQFEAGRASVGKGGVVKDPAAHAQAVAMASDLLRMAGFQPREAIDSPILGGDGNREFLLAATRG